MSPRITAQGLRPSSSSFLLGLETHQIGRFWQLCLHFHLFYHRNKDCDNFREPEANLHYFEFYLSKVQFAGI
jgi:hypothetical protein